MSKKKTKLNTVLTEIEKKHGKVIYTGKEIEAGEIPRLRSSIFGINIITGGGLKYNQLCELHGPPSTFKTTTALDFCAKTQGRFGGDSEIVWASNEGGVDLKWARHNGVKVPYTNEEIKYLKDRLDKKELDRRVADQESKGGFHLIRTESSETQLDIVQKLLESGEVNLYILDSFGAVQSSKEYEEGHGDAQVAINVRLIGKHTRKLHTLHSRLANADNHTACIGINQVRDVIGSRIPLTKTPGGYQLNHGKHLSIKARVAGLLRDKNDNVWAKEVIYSVEKSKICIPHRTTSITFVTRPDNPRGLPVGPDVYSEVINLGTNCGVLSWEGRAWTFREKPILDSDEKPVKKEDLPQAIESLGLLKDMQEDIQNYHIGLEIGL